jgi:hypothetical protein
MKVSGRYAGRGACPVSNWGERLVEDWATTIHRRIKTNNQLKGRRDA